MGAIDGAAYIFGARPRCMNPLERLALCMSLERMKTAFGKYVRLDIPFLIF